jgi:formylglycine-generating enzyme required for sulfatase activity
MYPSGASPQGALDMAGTVWEWCLNKFDTPDVMEAGSRDFDTRVLRGGSWLFGAGLARCANRYGDDPVIRSGSVGFRVLCSSPIVEH